MKVVILAGGFGTRLSENADSIPKPMVEIGEKPILWHIMKIYSHYGFNEFIICCGYKGYIIKEYFLNKFKYQSDVTIDYNTGEIISHDNIKYPWKVTLVDTGLNSMTGGRIKRIQHLINNETFLLTYGDGLSNVDIQKLIEHHKKYKRKVTVTSIQPFDRFGGLDIGDDNLITSFIEKKRLHSSWINGGYFVCEPTIFDYIKDDKTIFESDVLEKIALENQLTSYKHDGFWQCMDTLKEKNTLNDLWNNNKADWKMW
jgi:glucose-1-phosphate cytidylyltransferase